MPDHYEDRYGPDNQPASLADAEDRTAELRDDVLRIITQITGIKVQLSTGEGDEQQLVNWRARANAAKNHMERELSFLRHWKKAERARIRLKIYTDQGVDPNDSKSLLGAALRLLETLMKEDVEFEPEEMALKTLIEEHLAA